MKERKYNPVGWNNDRQLAQHYGVSRCTIWRWAKAGLLNNPVKHSTRVTRWLGDGKAKGEAAA